MKAEIQAVKRRYALADVAAQYTELRPGGHLLRGRCPFHPERTPSFFVNPRTGRWRCFGRCATGWLDVIDFYGWLAFGERWSARDAAMFREVFDRLRDRAPAAPPPRPAVAVPEGGPAPKTPDVMALLHRAAEMYEIALWALGDGRGTPLAYLHRRGLNDATIRSAHLGYASGRGLVKYLRRYGGAALALARELRLVDEAGGDREFFRGRILFPDHDAAGRVVHLCGRIWPDRPDSAAAKYLSLRGFDKPLYGWGQLDLSCSRPVFVTESPPDRLTLIQWGCDAVATLGTGLAPRAIQRLAACPRPLIFVPHNDGGAGLRAARAWRGGAGHGDLLELPRQVKDVNELGCHPHGQAIFRAALERLRAEVRRRPA